MSKKDKSVTPRNSKGEAYGYWERYWGDNLWYKGFYQNDKPLGYKEVYDTYTGGKLREKAYNI